MDLDSTKTHGLAVVVPSAGPMQCATPDVKCHAIETMLQTCQKLPVGPTIVVFSKSCAFQRLNIFCV